MWVGRNLVVDLLVPSTAVGIFLSAWGISAISQPINSLAFLTDGVHWGTGDFRYLRNAMLLASLAGIISIWILEQSSYSSLVWVWILIGGWNILRGLFGILRIWPGIGQSIFKETQNQEISHL